MKRYGDQVERTRKSIRKIKKLILLIVFTVIISITATYAWFSTRKDVEISTMRLNIEVAESMQISLDGEKWTQSIIIEDMRQFYGTYRGNANVHQAKSVNAEGNKNYVPTELLPVSSSGTVKNGELQFVQGQVYTTSDGKTGLKNITLCTENDLTPTETIENREDNNENHPFMVFDIYLKNISAKPEGEKDILKLNVGSRVWVDTDSINDYEGKGVAGTGLEYSARVGMVIYENNISVIAQDTEEKTVGEQVRELEDSESGTVAIWEPNHLNHIPYVVANNRMGITSTSQQVSTLTIKDTVTGDITDIYNWNDRRNLSKPITMTPTYELDSGTTEKASLTARDGSTELGLESNRISKVRVYIWMEGQDPDCISMASLGDKLNVNLKLTKDKTDGLDEISYEGIGGAYSARDIYSMPEDEKKEIYGGYVTNYASEVSDAQKSVNWRIFHADETNIYLIADDYVRIEYVPKARSFENVNAGGTRIFGMGDIADFDGTGAYVGIWSIRNNETVSKLINEYTYNSSTSSTKATAYLLDYNQWSVFANTSYAECAFGGPTIELFRDSYNAIHSSKTIETQANETGYLVKWSSDDNFNYSISGLSTSENLYVIDNVSTGMWVASPSAQYIRLLMSVSNTGTISTCPYMDSGKCGSRPIISLKSSARILKQEDGTYRIIN